MAPNNSPALSSKVRERLDSGQSVYVSITGLRLQRAWFIFNFFRHAVPSKMQAERADGNLDSQVLTRDGVRHTLTVWTSRKAMMSFAYSGAHRRAIAAFGKYFTGTTYGYETQKVPDWEEAIAIWKEKGRPYKGS